MLMTKCRWRQRVLDHILVDEVMMTAEGSGSDVDDEVMMTAGGSESDVDDEVMMTAEDSGDACLQ